MEGEIKTPFHKITYNTAKVLQKENAENEGYTVIHRSAANIIIKL